MKELTTFFDDFRQKFEQLATRISVPNSGTNVPRGVSSVHCRFSEDLYSLKNSICNRLYMFDSEAVITFENAVTTLDDKVTGWVFNKRAKAPTDVPDLLLAGQISMVKAIYNAKVNILK
jgi:hypothetical protein